MEETLKYRWGYSRSGSCCKQNMVFTPMLRSLSTSAGVCNQKNEGQYDKINQRDWIVLNKMQQLITCRHEPTIKSGQIKL